jgi:ribosomal protein L17
MRHRARAHKLSRTSAHRIAMYRNLVTSLLDHERVETTDAKAKELRRIADRMITLGKRGDLQPRSSASWPSAIERGRADIRVFSRRGAARETRRACRSSSW